MSKTTNVFKLKVSDEVLAKSLWLVASISPECKIEGKLVAEVCKKIQAWRYRKAENGKVTTDKDVVERVTKKLSVQRDVLAYMITSELTSRCDAYLKQFQEAAAQITLPSYVCLRKSDTGVYFTYRGHLVASFDLNYVLGNAVITFHARARYGLTSIYALPDASSVVERSIGLTRKYLQDKLAKYNVKLPEQTGDQS